MWRFLLFLILYLPTLANANSCNGLERNLDKAEKDILEFSVAKQLNLMAGRQTGDLEQKAIVLRVFSSNGWNIVYYVGPLAEDSIVLFYEGGIDKKHFLDAWGGATLVDSKENIHKEERGAFEWTSKHVPNIPANLEKCFAWYISRGQYE